MRIKNIICAHKIITTSFKHGLILKEYSHKVIKLKQGIWLNKYISLNTNFRTIAKNELDKNKWKLSNNLIFAKTIKNKRKRKNIVTCYE